jgi:hypothetical protein
MLFRYCPVCIAIAFFCNGRPSNWLTALARPLPLSIFPPAQSGCMV